MRKLLITLLFSSIATITKAQFSNIEISIAGLTCSQCSKSVEMQLKKIKFISNIKMDLKSTTAAITTKSDRHIDFNALAKAVTNAGFSVNKITAKLDLSRMTAKNNQCYTYMSDSYWLISPPESQQINIQFIGKAFGQTASNQDYSLCQGKTQYIIMPL